MMEDPFSDDQANPYGMIYDEVKTSPLEPGASKPIVEDTTVIKTTTMEELAQEDSEDQDMGPEEETRTEQDIDLWGPSKPKSLRSIQVRLSLVAP